MSQLVKLSSALPGKLEINGLDAIVDELIEDPTVLRWSVVIHNCPKANVDNINHITQPIVSVSAFEPMGLLKDMPDTIRQAVLDNRESRTGRTALPLDLVPSDESLGDEDDD